MVFSSTVFLFLFLPVVLALYFLVRPGLRNGVLLLASLSYYAWGESTFVRLVLYSTLGNYLFGLALQRLNAPLGRRLVLGLAVATNIGLLLWFKYANFALSTTNDLLALLHSKHAPLVLTPVVLPLGITWVFFRAPNLSAANTFLHALFGLESKVSHVYRAVDFLDHEGLAVFSLAIVGCTPIVKWIGRRWPRRQLAQEALFDLGKFAALVSLAVASAVKLSSGTYNPFIYFRF